MTALTPKRRIPRMKQDPPASVLCFGEVLWDILPDGMKPGGAPMNAAYHLHRNGITSNLSSVRRDTPLRITRLPKTTASADAAAVP